MRFLLFCEDILTEMNVDYREQVMRSIRRHKSAMHSLLADFKDKTDHLGPEEYFDQFYGNNRFVWVFPLCIIFF